MEQEIVYINIRDLVLWTENPRDSIDAEATDQNIVDRAFNDENGKWELPKLAKEMGDFYDFSELPTVVYVKGRPVVFDGNRRIVLGKIKHGLVSIPDGNNIRVPDFPDEIPCNVCSKDVALINVYRKHSDSGSWQPLERDIFLHRFMGKEKSLFLSLDENTHIISSNPHLNQRFVKEEIFKKDILESMGFTFKKGRLYSNHSDDEALTVFTDISDKIRKKIISTRKNRGKIKEVLEPLSQQLIDQNTNNQQKPVVIRFESSSSSVTRKRTRRTQKKDHELFGGKLYLNIGEVSDLYRDIVDLYDYYLAHKTTLSQKFPCLIRMALRLISETAASEMGMKLDDYLISNFEIAKQSLDKNMKTTLSSQNVSKESIVQLIHIGAHNYNAANNFNQTIALSIVIGLILTNTHGRD